jgi:hypothetical protein
VRGVGWMVLFTGPAGEEPTVSRRWSSGPQRQAFGTLERRIVD